MDAVAQARALDRVLNRSDVAVAMVIPGRGPVKNTNRNNVARPVIELDDLIPVLCFSSVSVVHGSICSIPILGTSKARCLAGAGRESWNQQAGDDHFPVSTTFPVSAATRPTSYNP